jgi:hypothetical protein
MLGSVIASLSLTDSIELVGPVDVLNVYTGEATSTDYQTISITLGPEWDKVPFIGTTTNSILGHCDDAGQNGIECRISIGTVEVWKWISGPGTLIWIEPLPIPPLPGETWTLARGWSSDHPGAR